MAQRVIDRISAIKHLAQGGDFMGLSPDERFTLMPIKWLAEDVMGRGAAAQ